MTLVTIAIVALAAIGIGVSISGSSGGGKKNGQSASTPAAAYSCIGAQSTIFNNSNIYGVVNGAKPPSFTTDDKAYCVTMIQTYHWNSGIGAKPGTLGLTKLSGPAGGAAKLGPYAAKSSSGQGGAPNVNWYVDLHATASTVIDGTYTCNDSNPVTWSSNPQSKSLGFCIVYGVPAIAKGGSGSHTSTTTTQAMKPTLTMGPVQANFNQGVFGTFYTVNPTELAARPIGYSWQLALKLVDPTGSPSPDQMGSGAGVDPGCNNNNVLSGTTGQFVWYHPDAVNSTPPGAYHCNHFLMGPKGHQGRITVTVSDGLWACTAHYDGTLTGAGPPAICGKVPTTTTTKVKFTCVGSQVKLFDNSNIQGVQNGGKPPSFSTGGQPYCVTRIQTYHWNSGRGSVPGRLGLAATSVAGSGAGTIGPLAAQSSSGQNNAPHVNWFVDIGTAVPQVIDGTYNCTDSGPATWSTNGQDSGLGFCAVYGVPAQAAP